MERTWWWKFVLLLFLTILSVGYIYPTIKNLDPKTSKFPITQKMNLGLDLQGGLYLVMGVDFLKVYDAVLNNQVTAIQSRAKDKGIALKSVSYSKEGSPADDHRVVIELDPAQHEVALKLLKDEFQNLRLTLDQPNRIELGIAHTTRSDIREKTIDQSIEVIRNRIDQFGVAEPSITSQGIDRIVVELPGISEVERAKELIGRTAKLEFKIVDEKGMEPAKFLDLVRRIEEEQKISYAEGQKFSEYVAKVNEAAKGKIPEGDIIAFERSEAPEGQAPSSGRHRLMPYLVQAKTVVSGNDLQDAQVSFDPENHRPEVSFTFNPRGATLFEALTGENIGHRLAIVLDGMVYPAPVIQSKIGAHGRITLGRGVGDELMKEAKDLAIVLRAGALPAQLEFLEQRVVGPSLGNDSIRKGSMAGVIGVLLVFLFTIFYYRVSGMIAVVSLVLNVLFVLAILVGLEATLTLPGIAGIALTVGIAVDSNVVIYERIREELRSGKSLRAAVEAGFQKAFRTILDANVTNACAALVLLAYGTGPVKGFAVTMLIGIVTTLFTAVFACRVMFDLYLKRLDSRNQPSLSI